MSEEQEQLREALKRTAVALKEGGVAFALGGGYAGWALGGPEPEHDVDFLVSEDDAERAEQVLRDTGLRVEHPPEDWLFKVFDDDAMVDIIFRVAGEPVPTELLERAQETEVLSVRMPVLEATDLLVTKMVALSEHDCDFGKVLPSARALREQVDWQRLRRETEHSPFAVALLFLAERLSICDPHEPDLG
jgi:predicted nucleotidyltransferase